MKVIVFSYTWLDGMYGADFIESPKTKKYIHVIPKLLDYLNVKAEGYQKIGTIERDIFKFERAFYHIDIDIEQIKYLYAHRQNTLEHLIKPPLSEYLTHYAKENNLTF